MFWHTCICEKKQLIIESCRFLNDTRCYCIRTDLFTHYKMIITQLKGGLGNQLFQYAAGYSLARYHKVPVKVDLRNIVDSHQNDTLRQYGLQHLNAPPEMASDDEIAATTHVNLFEWFLQKLLPSYRRKIYNEKLIGFDKNFFNARSNIYLKGYRQSEKYFLPYACEIRKLFTLQSNVVLGVQNCLQQLKKSNSVSVHIRHGDYSQAAIEYHGILHNNYYQQAIDRFATANEKATFFIFSDDIEWVKNNLVFSGDVQFVSGNISKTQYEDFYLMSQCKHNIIANSTFSWWAAWLNANPDKIVIAPKKWYNKPGLDTTDLIPESWIRI